MMRSLDKAIEEYVTALAAFEQARNELEETLKTLGLSDELVSKFIEELKTKKPKRKVGVKKPREEKKSKEEKAKPVKEIKPEDIKPKRRKRKNVVPVEDGQVVEDGKYFVYRVDGKLKRTKTVPLYKYGNTVLAIDKDGQFFLGMVDNRGRGSTFSEKIILEQVRSIIHKLETDQIEPGILTVYEGHVNYFLPRMRVLAKEQFEQLLDSYKAWLRRVEDENAG